jgi:hypothetical protein
MTKTQNNLEGNDPPVTILDPEIPLDESTIANPFLVLKLDASDRGNRFHKPIDNNPNFLHRTPYCVDWSRIGENIVTLKISNLGLVASDLIKVNYQFVFCVVPGHGVDVGFIHPHSGEETDSQDGFRLFSHLAAKSDLNYEVAITKSLQSVKNLYFRARVSTFWEKPVKPEDWDVLTDKAVIESTHKF